MTMIALTPAQRAAAFAVAREIGSAFQGTRQRRGDAVMDVAIRLDMAHTTVRRFEAGASHNLKLGNAMRMLQLYGLKLAVVPIDPAPALVNANRTTDVHQAIGRSFACSHQRNQS